MTELSNQPGGGRGRFATTRWSLVVAAGDRRDASSDRALAELCTDYWYPLYAFARRSGYDADQARDLTQSFFVHLLEKDSLAQADPTRGRFRTFLLSAMKNFLTGEWRRRSALKRGGGTKLVSIDFDSAEETYRIEPSGELSPEEVYQRRWALSLLDRAIEEVRTLYTESGRGELFDALKGCLGGDEERLPYAELSQRLGLKEGAVRTSVFRLRDRWRKQLRQIVAETVEDETTIDDEIRSLLSSLV